jgi:hypothetical protein
MTKASLFTSRYAFAARHEHRDVVGARKADVAIDATRTHSSNAADTFDQFSDVVVLDDDHALRRHPCP